MPSVFLSYAREDLSLIEQLEAQLKGHTEISVWRDQEKIYGGQKWPKVLGEAIADQDVFLLAWSKNSSASHFVEFEWCTAIALKKTIVPCLLDRTPLSPSLETFHGYCLDDVPELIGLLRAAPLANKRRRKPVIRRLNEIAATEETAVLAQAKSIFAQQQWIVQGNVYQAGGDIHIHEAPTQGKACESVLRGRMFYIKDNDDLAPAPNVNVTLVQTSVETVTSHMGRFDVPLTASLQPGVKVQVEITHNEWVIYSPIDGELTIPALDTELVKIRLVKKGSPKLWSAERIEKFIQDMASKAKEQVRPEGKPQEIDFSRYIKDWASKYGFSAHKAKAGIDRWVADIEQQEDLYHLGLAAYAKKNFVLAGKHFEKSAERKLNEMRAAEEMVQKLREEVVRDYSMAGDTRYSQYDFKSALVAYTQALQLVSQKMNPMLWATLHNDIGSAHLGVGLHMEGEQTHHHFTLASQAYKVALRIYSKARYPQQWATTINRLSNLFRERSVRTQGRASTRLLNQAIAYSQAALTVQTRETSPIDWAKTYVNLANALREKGRRRGGRVGIGLLRNAIKAHQTALKVLTKSCFSQEWAKIQNNLGLAQVELGKRLKGREGDTILQRATAGFSHALEIYRQKSTPAEWAWAQHNTGYSLKEQGVRHAGAAGLALLHRAEKAYLAALKIYSRRRFPQDYALALCDLAAVRAEIGMRIMGKKGVIALERAMKVARKALKIFTKKSEPVEWARTQYNLGVLFREQSKRVDLTTRKQLIRQEIKCYNLALQIRTKQTMPEQWRLTNDNLKSAQRQLLA